MIELRHLRYFVVLAEELHFTSAATRLHVAQPALSQNVQQMEEILGVKLFKRDKRNVSLTSAGETFLIGARRTLDDLTGTCVATQRACSTNRVLLGYTPSSFSGKPLAIVSNFRSLHPTIQLGAQEGATETLLNDVRTGKFDIVFTEISDIDSSLQSLEIDRLSLYCAISEKHPLAHKHVLYIKDLADIPFILGEPGAWASHHDNYIRQCELAGFTPKVHYYVNTFAGGLSLARGNFGVLPCYLTHQLNEDGIVFTKLAGTNEDAALRLVLTYRRDNTSAVVSSFLEVAHKCINESRPAQL